MTKRVCIGRSISFSGLSLLAFGLLCCTPDFDSLMSGRSACSTAQGACGGESGLAGGGGASCVTAFPNGTVKRSFDDLGHTKSGLAFYPEDPTGRGAACTGSIAATTGDWNGTEGHACPGAFEVFVPFGSYETRNRVDAILNFDAEDWTGFSVLHAWIKLKSPDVTTPSTNPATYLGTIELVVQSSSDGAKYDGYLYVSAPAPALLSDRKWHELKLALPAADNQEYHPTAVLNIGIQVSVASTPPGAAPATPPDTTFEIDDIWLE
jgi:hypothetical protein